MATLRHRITSKGKICYYADYVLEINGKKTRRRETIGIVSKAEANRILDKVRGDLAMRKFDISVIENESNEIYFSDFIYKYLEYSKINKAFNTYNLDKHSLINLLGYIGNINLNQIKEIDIENYKINRIRSVKETSINIELRHIKSALQKAFEWNLIKNNPARNIKQIKIKSQNIPQYLSKEEINRLLEIIQEPEFKNLVLFYLYTGCRRNEALNLQWKDIDLNNEKIIIRETKSGRSRVIPINSELFNILKNFENKNGHIFNYRQSYVTHKLKKYLQQINADYGRSVHILRHTFASNMIMSGVDIYSLSKILGHSSVKQTEIYSHLSQNFLSESINKLKY